MAASSNINARVALSGASVLALALLAAAPALAQDTAPQGSETSQPDDDASTENGEIVVTGSSIRGVPPTGSNLISVTREDIRTVGASTTAGLLASVPQLNSFNT